MKQLLRLLTALMLFFGLCQTITVSTYCAYIYLFYKYIIFSRCFFLLFFLSFCYCVNKCCNSRRVIEPLINGNMEKKEMTKQQQKHFT